MTDRTPPQPGRTPQEDHREDRRKDRRESRQEDAEATALRQARFGALPERIRPQDTVETKPATLPDPARDRYDPDEWLVRYCL